ERRHRFRIEEFRRPEFEVNASASAGPHLVSGHGQFTAKASYFSGGPLPYADVEWHVTATPGHFRPTGHEGYTFVGWRPSWWRGRGARGGSKRGGEGQRFKAQLDGRGQHMLRVDFHEIDPPRPMVLRGAATIHDVNRRAWTAKTQLLVHPSRAYVGLKTKRYFVERGKPLDVEGVVVDIDGKVLAGRAVEVQALRLQWAYKERTWQREEVDAQMCRRQMSAKPFSCTFKTEKGGTYLLRASVQDEQGRKNVTEMTRWVSGGKMPPKRRIEQERVELIAHKKEYKPGEVAEILVRAPFDGAEGMLTVQRGGILRHERFKVQGRSHTLRVKLGARDMPRLHVQVDLVGKAERVDDRGQKVQGAPPRPAFARGSLSLNVPARERALEVKVAAADPRASPGAQTSIAVHVKDAAGKPVAGAEVALVVVDEAVLALTGYSLADPLSAFYPVRSGGVSNLDSRRWVELADPLALARAAGPGQAPEAESKREGRSRNGDAAKGMLGGARATPTPSGMKAPRSPKRSKQKLSANKDLPNADARGEANAAPIALRKDFRPLALFSPRLETGADGKVQVPFKLPDNLTRYRVMAVAVHGAKYYGKGESNLTARLPLMIRPSPPRFLNFGDKAEIPVVLHNQTGDALSVRVAMRAQLVTLRHGAAGREFTIPADDRVEVRFPVEARAVGRAEFQLGVASGRFADAAKFSFPVWTPATTEAFATYGAVDKGAIVQPVKMPKGVVQQFGGLEVTTSSTAVSALSDAVLYLVAYPYECSEQLSSRILAVAALKDVLAAFKAPGLPPPAKILGAVSRDLRRLRQLQNSDGGFPFWVRGKRSWPYLSVHVAHALLRAKEKGFAVNPTMLSRVMNHLRRIESHIPGWYSKGARQAIIAYSLYVRKLAGERDVAKARSLFAKLVAGKSKGRKVVNLEAVGWIYPVLSHQAAAKAEVLKIRRLLNNRVTETAAGAHFVTSYSDGAHLILHSKRRVDGILLDGLIEDQPKSDLILKIVRGLLAHRKRGRWGNTQENAWVLLGLDRYFRRYEKATPNFVARAWLGEQFVGKHAFRGRTTERHEISIPMEHIAKMGGGDLLLAKQGRGRLYYRIGMRYAPADLKPPAVDHGFTVTRSYEAVDKPGDVKRDQDGTWRVKAGARVRVRLRMVATTRRYHVALVDPLPAGLEPINSALRGAEDTPGALNKPGGQGLGRRHHGLRGSRGGFRRYRFWRRHWYEHQNLRDERAEVFSSLVWGGVHEYSYLARATTPGTFVVPPPKAEEMYHPETFGRGAGDRLVVR
ncbi:MAG: hypothetical protein JRH20_23990, partial [Deltaproteobacteria bacterium]|nr:hypothetical protein [Deltaproteobacteria bacterium]